MRPSLQPRKYSLYPNQEANEAVQKLHEQNKIGKSKKILYVLIILLIIGIVLLTGGCVEYQHPAGISGNQISGISPDETPHYPHSFENGRGTWILIDASKGKYQLVGTNETLETIQPYEPTPIRDAIIGKWQCLNTSTLNATIQFSKDGTIAFSWAPLITANYRFMDDTHLRVDAVSPFNVSSVVYVSISGNELVFDSSICQKVD